MQGGRSACDGKDGVRTRIAAALPGDRKGTVEARREWERCPQRGERSAWGSSFLSIIGIAGGNSGQRLPYEVLERGGWPKKAEHAVRRAERGVSQRKRLKAGRGRMRREPDLTSETHAPSPFPAHEKGDARSERAMG